MHCLIFILFFTLIGCHHNQSVEEYEDPDFEKAMAFQETEISLMKPNEILPFAEVNLPFSEVIIPYAYELEEEKRLRFEDAKIYYTDAVSRIQIIFSTQQIIELKQARELIVDVVENLLDRLNDDARIRASFAHNPITANDLEIYISFESFYVEYQDPTYMAWMSLHEGDVRYYTGLLKDHNKDFWLSRIEPYFKSLEYVRIRRGAEKNYQMRHPIPPPVELRDTF